MSHALLEAARFIFALLVKLAMSFAHIEDPVVELLEMIEEMGGV